MSKFLTEVSIQITGGADKQIARVGQSFKKMSRDGQQAFGALQRSAVGFSNQLDKFGNKYTALFSGVGAGVAIKYLGDLQRRFTRLGITADISSAQVEKVKTQLFDIARRKDIAVPVEQLMDAVDIIVEKRGDLKLATDNLANIGYAIQASGAAGQDIGSMIADMQEKFGLGNEQEFLRALDTLVVQGKAGAFTLNNLATQGNRVTSAMARTGRQGADSLREMGATLQIFRQGTGSAEQATTAFERVISNLFDKQKEIKKMGVQLFDPKEMARGRQVLRPLSDVLKEIIIKTKGDEAILGKLVGEEGIRGISVLARMFRNTGAFAEYDKFLQLQGDGSVLMADSARAAKDLQAAMDRLMVSLQKLGATRLTQPIEKLADAMNALAENTDMFNNVVGGGLGLATLIGGNQLVRGAAGALQGLGGGAAAAAGGAEAVAATATGVATEAAVGSSFAAGLMPAAQLGKGAMFANGARGALGVASKVALPLALTMGAIDIGAGVMSGNRDQLFGALGRTGGSFGGAMAGSALGAGLGTMILPGIGTAIGGVAGGILGGVGGSFGGGALGAGISQAMTAADIEQAMLRANNQTTKKDMMEVGIRVELAGNSMGASLNVIDFLSQGDSDVRLGRVAAR